MKITKDNKIIYPKVVDFRINSECHYNCEYCYGPKLIKGLPFREIEVIIRKLKDFGCEQIVVTGGEPLLQVDFLKGFVRQAKERLALPALLETNGTLPDHLMEIIDDVDIISMDIKLPSATDQSPYWQEHKKFLEIAGLKKVYVKIVFTKETKMVEIDQAAELVAAVSPDIPLILQPVTPHGAIKHRPGCEEIMSFQAAAKRKLKEVRVIPQIHRVLGIV